MSIWHVNRWVVLSLSTIALNLGPTMLPSAWAQKPKNEPAKNKVDQTDKPEGVPSGVSMEIAKAEGKWDAFAQGIIKILDTADQEVFLQSQGDTVFHYTAEAEPAWLMPGYMVRFSATFDQSGKPTAALKAIEVFTPMMKRRLSPEEMREQSPGVYQEEKGQPEGAKDLFADKKPNTKGRPSKKEPKEAVGPAQSFRVVGQLIGVQNNVLAINAGRPIQIEIDPAAIVTVSANDLNAAAPMIVKGDSVAVTGLRNPAQPSQIYCESITIKAEKKLTQAMPAAKKGKTSARDKDKDKDKEADAKGSKDGKDTKTKPDSKKPTTSDKKPQ